MLSPGHRLQGRYTVLRLAGQGEMGAVYYCSDDRLPEALWVLKELHQAPREAQVLSSLEHPRLPHIVDFFAEGDKFYLVREYVNGPDLAQKVNQTGPLREDDALSWALEMAEVLVFLHSQHPPMLYRALKPQNVVVCPDGLKLIDFGLARELTAEEALPEAPVRSGDSSEVAEPQGSLSYIAPEAREGRSRGSEASDLYSLGAVLYFLMTGHGPPPAFPPSFPAHWQPLTKDLIQRCLDPDPRNRHSSAQELFEAIQAARHLLPPRPALEPSWLPRLGAMVGLLALFTLMAAFLLSALPHPRRYLRLQPWLKQAERPTAWSQMAADAPPTSAKIEAWLARFPASGVPRVLKTNAATRPGAIHIPILAPLSGDYSEEGEWMVQGAAVLADELGERAPFLELCDTQSRAPETLDAVLALVKRKEILAAVGPFSSQMSLLVAPLCNMEHLSLVAPGPTDPRVETSGPYLFALTPSRTSRLQIMAEAVERRGARRVLILQQDAATIFYQLADHFEARVRGTERVSLRRVYYPNDLMVSGDFAEQVFSRPFDTVFLAENRPGPAAQIIIFLRRNGFKGPIACLVDPGSQDLLDYGGPQVEGVLSGSFACLETARFEAFRQRYRCMFGREPNCMSPLAYLCVRQAWEATQTETTREGVQRELARRCRIEDVFGPEASLAACYRIEGGKYVLDLPAR